MNKETEKMVAVVIRVLMKRLGVTEVKMTLEEGHEVQLLWPILAMVPNEDGTELTVKACTEDEYEEDEDENC